MMKKIYILAVVAVLSVISAAAQDVSRQESRKAKLEREIELLDQQIAQNFKSGSAQEEHREPQGTCQGKR